MFLYIHYYNVYVLLMNEATPPFLAHTRANYAQGLKDMSEDVYYSVGGDYKQSNPDKTLWVPGGSHCNGCSSY